MLNSFHKLALNAGAVHAGVSGSASVNALDGVGVERLRGWA